MARSVFFSWIWNEPYGLRDYSFEEKASLRQFMHYELSRRECMCPFDEDLLWSVAVASASHCTYARTKRKPMKTVNEHFHEISLAELISASATESANRRTLRTRMNMEIRLCALCEAGSLEISRSRKTYHEKKTSFQQVRLKSAIESEPALIRGIIRGNARVNRTQALRTINC